MVRRNTGDRGYRELFAALDAWGAAERPHAEIARWLSDEYGIPGWWCQNITVEYERARGLRPVGGDRDGTLNVSASKTVAVPAERVYEAFAGRWPELRQRTAQPPRSARFDWEDGATRVLVTFTAKGVSKTTVAVSHERIADDETAARLKGMWRERLAELKGARGVARRGRLLAPGRARRSCSSAANALCKRLRRRRSVLSQVEATGRGGTFRGRPTVVTAAIATGVGTSARRSPRPHGRGDRGGGQVQPSPRGYLSPTRRDRNREARAGRRRRSLATRARRAGDDAVAEQATHRQASRARERGGRAPARRRALSGDGRLQL